MSLLRLSSVTKSYRRGSTSVPVLNGASLTVEPGSLTSVYGAPRSGKSTLLRIAAGFERPDSGEVFFAGGEIGWVLDDRSPTRQLDVTTCIALPLYRELGPPAARRRARDTLAALGSEQYADEQWDSLGDAARALCAIARATVRRPRLLIADTPTAGLGLVDRERVCGALRTAAAHYSLGVLIAAPDLPSMLGSHQTLLLSRGRLLGPAGPDLLDGNVVELRRRA